MRSTSAPATKRQHRVAAAFIGLVLLAATGCADNGDAAGEPTPASPYSPYVAIGDSYTAVSGVDTSIGDPCLRSESAYPGLLASELKIADFVSVACGGATTANLTSTQYPLGKGRNEPQLDALSEQTKLVTVGIGLNDNAYSTLTLVSCFPVNGKEQSSCAPYLAQPQSYLDDLVATIGRNVADGLKAIKAAAPNARVIFIGYPRLLATNKDCDAQVPLPPKALERVRTSGVDVNTTLRRVAERAGVDFLDMYTASAGHDVCSKQPWVNGQLSADGQAFPFHPFPAYHEAVAAELVALLSSDS